MNRLHPEQKEKYLREERMAIVARGLRRGMSMRAIARLIKDELSLQKLPSVSLVHKDAQKLLKEWQETRIQDFSLKVEAELAQIDEAIDELWSQWEKSKTDQKVRLQKQKATVIPGRGEVADELVPTEVDKTTKEVINCGDVRYIAEIREQQKERRRILGIYAPDKSDDNINLNVQITTEDVKAYQDVFNKEY